MNAYRVPVAPATIAGTPKSATADSSYQPPPVGVPCTEATSRRNCLPKEASKVEGAEGETVWFAAPASDHEANAYRVPAETDWGEGTLRSCGLPARHHWETEPTYGMPSTRTSRGIGVVRTVTWCSVSNVAVNVAAKFPATTEWMTPPPSLQDPNTRRDWGPLAWGLSAKIAWDVPGRHEKVAGAVNCWPSTATTSPVGTVSIVTGTVRVSLAK